MRLRGFIPGSGARAAAGRRAERAYALVIIAGTLAILAILAAVLVPNRIQLTGEADREREAEALQRLKEGLREYILATRTVPAPTTVFSNVAGTIGWDVAQALTNHRRNPRLFFLAPNFRLGTNTASTLPFVQGTYGFTNTSNLRMMFLSSLGGPLPAMLTNPGTNAATVFSMVWNAADGQTPPGWTWGGDWADIRVARLSLDPWITRIRLLNGPGSTGRFSVDNTNASVALPTNDFSALYFVRSQLGLHSHVSPYPVQILQVMQDVPLATNGPPYLLMPTFVYEDGVWRGRFYKGTDAQKHNGEDLQWAYDIFMSGPPNVYKVGSVTQDSLTRRMWEYMSNYVRWTELGFSSSFKNSVLQPSQQAMVSELGTYCNKMATAN